MKLSCCGLLLIVLVLVSPLLSRGMFIFDSQKKEYICKDSFAVEGNMTVGHRVRFSQDEGLIEGNSIHVTCPLSIDGRNGETSLTVKGPVVMEGNVTIPQLKINGESIYPHSITKEHLSPEVTEECVGIAVAREDISQSDAVTIIDGEVVRGSIYDESVLGDIQDKVEVIVGSTVGYSSVVVLSDSRFVVLYTTGTGYVIPGVLEKGKIDLLTSFQFDADVSSPFGCALSNSTFVIHFRSSYCASMVMDFDGNVIMPKTQMFTEAAWGGSNGLRVVCLTESRFFALMMVSSNYELMGRVVDVYPSITLGAELTLSSYGYGMEAARYNDTSLVLFHRLTSSASGTHAKFCSVMETASVSCGPPVQFTTTSANYNTQAKIFRDRILISYGSSSTTYLASGRVYPDGSLTFSGSVASVANSGDILSCPFPIYFYNNSTDFVLFYPGPSNSQPTFVNGRILDNDDVVLTSSPRMVKDVDAPYHSGGVIGDLLIFPFKGTSQYLEMFSQFRLPGPWIPSVVGISTQDSMEGESVCVAVCTETSYHLGGLVPGKAYYAKIGTGEISDTKDADHPAFAGWALNSDTIFVACPVDPSP